MKILLDPGHGGKDPGASGSRRDEHELNLIASLHLGGFLLLSGHTVYFTRLSLDQTVTLQERVSLEHELRPDLFLSIHCNSSLNEQARGFECFYFKRGFEVAKRLAASLASKSIIPLRQPPYKHAKFYVLRKTYAPAVLLELGFLSNKQDELILNNKDTLLDLLWLLSQSV